MNTCWKCGKELPEGQTGECEYGCAAAPSFPTDAQIKEALIRQNQRTVEIDWEKLRSVEDLRVFLRCCFGDRIYFPLGVPEAIKPFLKDQ